ncbi:MAG: Transcription antitermination protein nusG [Candidatus Daviesbacteria bacterium GW2011_GWB1_36_5]|uniref:Transcription termination/antitermination protein NusG n=2 Tax=Candidatus Daviesiibacteriota TaxID=1752718 RepID=A0A0G0HAE6_9BACT|nr:MAG: Transcription antitermination protein nusG [Candidatus Daviesbacteria bacterium GW2011_GWB1_36_5]
MSDDQNQLNQNNSEDSDKSEGQIVSEPEVTGEPEDSNESEESKVSEAPADAVEETPVAAEEFVAPESADQAVENVEGNAAEDVADSVIPSHSEESQDSKEEILNQVQDDGVEATPQESDDKSGQNDNLEAESEGSTADSLQSTEDAEVGSQKTEDNTEDEEPAPLPPAEAQKGKWYVVHTFAGHENKVKAALTQRIDAEHLENKIFQILVPTQDKIEIRAGKKETVKEKIFPGYILVLMELDDISWLAVRTTPGVTSFVGMGNKPTPVSNAEIASIIKFTTQGAAPTFKDVFMVDDTVKIIDGPFAEFIGKVDSVDKEKGRVRVLVSIFGRETPVELDFLQVQKL